MAYDESEVVTIPRREFERLVRDSKVLAEIGRRDARLHPGREPLPALVAELIESRNAVQSILAAHVRRLDSRGRSAAD